MKKKFFLMIVLMAFIVLVPGCKSSEYLAHITVVNIGDIPIYVVIAELGITVEALDSYTVDIVWEDDIEIIEDLYAEPIGYNDSDEVTVALADGDVYTWLVGWELAVQGSTPKKIPGKLVKK